MIKLYSEEDFRNGTSLDLFKLQCIQCNNTFTKTKKYINQCFSPNRKETGQFCSRRCKNLHLSLIKDQTPQEISCDRCKKLFIKKKSQILKTNHNFCSKQCAGIFSNQNKNKGYTRSKLEIYLEYKLTEKLPLLEFKFNTRHDIGYELDIFVPSLKLAFELNGILHYSPIFGNTKLNKIKNNYKLKTIKGN